MFSSISAEDRQSFNGETISAQSVERRVRRLFIKFLVLCHRDGRRNLRCRSQRVAAVPTLDDPRRMQGGWQQESYCGSGRGGRNEPGDKMKRNPGEDGCGLICRSKWTKRTVTSLSCGGTAESSPKRVSAKPSCGVTVGTRCTRFSCQVAPSSPLRSSATFQAAPSSSVSCAPPVVPPLTPEPVQEQRQDREQRRRRGCQRSEGSAGHRPMPALLAIPAG